MTYIQNSLENTVIGENWIPAAKDIAKLVTMKFYQAHNEKFSTSLASRLDDDANRLGLLSEGYSFGCVRPSIPSVLPSVRPHFLSVRNHISVPIGQI